MHLIPADDAIKAVLFAARVGQVLSLDGELVDVTRKNGWAMKSSLTRDDTGAGACEVIYVRAARIEKNN
jgi:hypothetical protein